MAPAEGKGGKGGSTRCMSVVLAPISLKRSQVSMENTCYFCCGIQQKFCGFVASPRLFCKPHTSRAQETWTLLLQGSVWKLALHSSEQTSCEREARACVWGRCPRDRSRGDRGAAWCPDSAFRIRAASSSVAAESGTVTARLTQ